MDPLPREVPTRSLRSGCGGGGARSRGRDTGRSAPLAGLLGDLGQRRRVPWARVRHGRHRRRSRRRCSRARSAPRAARRPAAAATRTSRWCPSPPSAVGPPLATARRRATTSTLASGSAEAGQPLQRLAELARDDPHLVGVALRDLRQRLQVLVGQQPLVGLAVVDGLEDRLDRTSPGPAPAGTARRAHPRRAGSGSAARPPPRGSPPASCPRPRGSPRPSGPRPW